MPHRSYVFDFPLYPDTGFILVELAGRDLRLRDGSENGMAVTAAVRQLESREERMDQQAGGRSAPPAPGVVIVIEQPGRSDRINGPPPPVIEVQPIEDV